MRQDVSYSRGERAALLAVAACGLIGLNGAFVFGLLARPGALQAALGNPISLAFLAEAMLLMFVLGYFLPRWGATRRSWIVFVALSLLGGIAFALPLVLLWPGRSGSETSSEV